MQTNTNTSVPKDPQIEQNLAAQIQGIGEDRLRESTTEVITDLGQKTLLRFQDNEPKPSKERQWTHIPAWLEDGVSSISKGFLSIIDFFQNLFIKLFPRQPPSPPPPPPPLPSNIQSVVKAILRDEKPEVENTPPNVQSLEKNLKSIEQKEVSQFEVENVKQEEVVPAKEIIPPVDVGVLQQEISSSVKEKGGVEEKDTSFLKTIEEYELIFNEANSLAICLSELENTLKGLAFENHGDLAQFKKSMKDFKEIQDKISFYEDALPDYFRNQEISGRRAEIGLLLGEKCGLLATSFKKKTEFLQKIGIENAEEADLLNYANMGRFLHENDMLLPERIPFINQTIREMKERSWNALASETFEGALDKIWDEKQEDLKSLLNEEFFCNPALKDAILNDKDLMRLIAADLFMEVDVFGYEAIPAGLHNRGNSCYRNSSNQMLLHSPLIQLFKNSIVEAKQLLILKGNQLVDDRIKEIYHMLKIGVAFKQLINAYSENGKRRSKKVWACDRVLTNALIDSRWMPDLTRDSISFQQDAAAYLEVLLGIFGVPIQSEITNIAGVDKSIEVQPLTMLQIPLKKNVRSLQTLIKENFKTTVVNAPWKTYAEYKKKEQIKGPPLDTILIHLKRRDYNRTAKNYEYITAPIEVPLTPIDFAEAYGNNEKVLYDITGFTAYSPSNCTGASGHYFSYVRKEDGWYKCDDSVITPVSEEVVKKAQSQIYLITLQKRK